MESGVRYLISERECHDGDQQTEEELELPEPVLVEEQEREGVDDGDQGAAPERDTGRIRVSIRLNATPLNSEPLTLCYSARRWRWRYQ